MTVIIAEKPSLARNIVAGIQNIPSNTEMKKKNGYYEGGNFLVTWAFGHLFSLCDIEDYTKTSGKWSLESIPCFPEHFEFKLKTGSDKKTDPGTLKQFETIKYLCCREDVDTIVNAGDSDREGEIIIRICVEKTGALERTGKQFKRLWLPDQTPETVRKAILEMKSEEEYDSLADEGFARTYIDWLYGVNLTRFATLKTGTLLRVGRVIVPIVKAIYDRDMEIRHFVPDVYLAAVSKEKTKGEEIELISKTKFDKNRPREAQELCDKYNAAGAYVLSKKTKKEKINPGKLFSLSKLQNLLGKKYKMSMADSLAIVQKLYEEGYLTYPRTNSEYLATNEKDKIRKIISNIKTIGYPVVFKDGKNIFDDSKIESHSALTPTYKIPNKESLNEREMQVYQTVFRRFVAVFCEVIPDARDVGFKIGGGLFGQAGHRLVIELIQPQLRGLRLEHGVLQQRLGNQLLVDGIVAVVGQRDAVVARKLGIDAGVLLENVVQEDHAAIVFDDDLRVVVGLIQLNLRLKLGDALVGGVELRLKVSVLLGKGHRAAERERQNEAQNFPDHHVLPPQILFPQRELL